MGRAMIERNGRACDGLRRRRIHRPLRLRIPVARAASGCASRSAIRAMPISSSRSARSASSASSRPTSPTRQRPRRGRRARPRSMNLCGVFGRSMHGGPRRRRAQRRRGRARRRRWGAGPDLGDRRRPEIASPTTAARRARAKQAVRKAFPGATIIRPSLVFGPEDDLTNRFAAMARLPFLPVIAAKRNFQPVYVRDLAQGDRAWPRSIRGRIGGKTYEIGGPQVMSMVELHQRDPRDHRPEPGDRARCPISSATCCR